MRGHLHGACHQGMVFNALRLTGVSCKTGLNFVPDKLVIKSTRLLFIGINAGIVRC